MLAILGLSLMVIATIAIVIISFFDIEYHPVRDGFVSGVGIAGALVMLVALFSL